MRIADTPISAGADWGRRPLAVTAALVSAVFFGVNAVASKILYAPEACRRVRCGQSFRRAGDPVAGLQIKLILTFLPDGTQVRP